MARINVPALDRPTAQQLAAIREQQQAYADLGPAQQMAWDSYLWQRALEQPGTIGKQPLLRHVFMVLRWGGMMFRPKKSENNWRRWSDVGWAIASAISHGGRVMIQLPRTRPGQAGEDHGFFRWLTDGLAGQGECFERQGTHSTGNRVDNWSQLLDGRIKVLEELKGLGHGAGQGLGTSKGKSYGVNLALGGNLSKTMATNHLITDNGDHGHLYLFHRPPTPDKFGGVLIGTEGEAPGRWGASGNYHSWNIGFWDKIKGYRPSQNEGQFGMKWGSSADRNRFRLPDAANAGALIGGPDKYDSLIIDLTATGWRFLAVDHEHQWDDAMVSQPAQAPKAIADVPKRLRRQAGATALGAAAGPYLQLPQSALQLRLALFTDNLKGTVPEGLEGDYQQEFDELVQAIYGN